MVYFVYYYLLPYLRIYYQKNYILKYFNFNTNTFSSGSKKISVTLGEKNLIYISRRY